MINAKYIKFEDNFSYGLIDTAGNIVLEPIYDYIDNFKNGYAAVKKDDLWGFIDENLNLIIDCKYYDYRSFSSNKFTSVKFTEYPGSWGIIDNKGNKIDLEKDYGFYFIGEFNNNLAIAKYYGIWCLIDNQGNVVNNNYFTDLIYFDNQKLYVSRKLYNTMIINELEEVKVLPEYNYEEIYYKSNGMYQVMRDNKFGYMDETGEEVIEAVYHLCYEFSKDSDLAFVMIDDKKGGYINKNNEFVIPPIYNFGNIFNFGLTSVLIDDNWIFIDENGNKLFDKEFLFAEGFTENKLARVQLKSQEPAFIDLEGNIVFKFPKKYEPSSFFFSNTLSTFKFNNKVGLFNSKGDIVLPAIYDEIIISKNGKLHAYRSNDKWGYLDDEGKIVIKAQYNSVGEFSTNDLTAVSYDDKFYVIDIYGNIEKELSDQIIWAGNFNSNNKLLVKLKDNEYAYIDIEDYSDIDNTYFFASQFHNGEAIVNEFEQYKLLDIEGNTLFSDNEDKYIFDIVNDNIEISYLF